LAMVQDVLFGLETSWEGIRFRPFLTSGLRQHYFGSTNAIELRNFAFRGTRHRVRVHLPPVQAQAQGIYPVRRIEFNGKRIGQEFVAADSLRLSNCWDVFLEAPRPQPHGPELRRVDVANQRALFGPLQPTWDEARQSAITLEQDRLVLHYQHPDRSNVVFNIYRDGQLCAHALTQTQWTDPRSADYRERVHHYTVEALDARTGNASHLSPTRCYVTDHQQWVIPAKTMEHRGGKLIDGHHFADWGRPDHELAIRNFTVMRSGHYLVRAQFANGSGPVNTGITCGVKRLEIRNSHSQSVAGAGYLIMPQSGNWRRFDLSSPVEANLLAGETYSMRIWEDDCSLNMSWLEQNRRYTAWPGGGETSYDFTDIAGLQLLRLDRP
ncbi:MAG TPA: hypothetical protein VNT26_10570, partial [Candidatus Sulfotelmatobacter sp.]|nr:hypothetical protein [Candidatus Sulfotelmatobacter sp.]